MVRHVHLLDLDPDLGQELDPEREAAARQHLVVRVERVATGRWAPRAEEFGVRGGLGLLITEGMAVRRVALEHRAAGELLAAGDVMRPWEDDGEHAAYPLSATFRVVEALSIAALDASFTRRLMHFPEIVSVLMGRVMTRSRRLVGNLAIAQLTSAEMRLHVSLWHLADRFGRVRQDGVVLPLVVTHETIGLLIGARRPSVTAAFGRLVDRELVEVLPEGGWLLKGNPATSIVHPRR